MDKFIGFMEKHFIPIASKIGSQRHLVAIRDGFIVTMPLMILGSFGVLINNLPIPAYIDFMNGIFGEGTWQAFGNNLSAGTFSILGLLIAFTVAYNLAKSYNQDALGAMATGPDGLLTATGLGSQGLFLALIVSIISTEIFRRLAGNPRLVINMPDGVPPAVSRSFAALFPAMITVSIFALFTAIFQAFGVTSIVLSFYELVQQPFMGLANSYPAALLLGFISAFLWFFGLHGANIIDPFMQTINVPAIEANARALEAGTDLPYIVNKPFFDSFVNIGGTGATLGLLIAIFLVARHHKAYMTVAKLSVAPGVFMINEPVMFGLPVVLNPILFIPYVLTPLVLVTTAYFATATGLVPASTVIAPWTTPPIIGGILSTQSIAGGILAAVNLILSIVIYLPFVKMAQIQETRRLKNA
ncbi:PTS system, cellobiose-specific IIC component [Enterococcus sp. DIV0421]|uniref:PTS sugar transporter subunit IIC n=1 Tax=Enterococcus sp. DIV0421 TaxID=2774688 RepID=UPI003F244CA2